MSRTLGALFHDGVPGLAVAVDDVLSGDIAAPALHPAPIVLRPAYHDQVSALVRIARREGICLYQRGGGWSYTGGYTPGPAPSALIDSRALTGIEIKSDKVVVGAGTTWATLYDELAAAGLRVLSFGPLSGLGATVGGGVAQDGGFFGAAGHGALGDDTICGGTLITGTGDDYTLRRADRVLDFAAPQPLAGDCGAFGLHTSVALRVMPMPTHTRFASFHFLDGSAAYSTLARLAGIAHLGEAYVFDPGTHANLARTGFSVIESSTIAGDLLRGTGGLLARLGGLLQTARAGGAFMADLQWSLHVSCDGSEAETAATYDLVTRLALAAGGAIIADTIPRVTRARPFRRIKALLGPDGERWLPVHGVFPAELAVAGLAAVQRVLAEARADMAAHGVRCVILGVLMGRRVIVEPQLFWPDALTSVHRRMALPDQVASYGGQPPRPRVREFALQMRRQLIAALDGAGASHFQIGRIYAAHPGVPSSVREAWTALKARFDPDNIINPGVLGLGQTTARAG